MTKVRWTSSGFKGGDSSDKCPATAGNRARRGGAGRKGNYVLWGGVFVLDPCVGDNMADSPKNHISPLIWSGFQEARTVLTVEF